MNVSGHYVLQDQGKQLVLFVRRNTSGGPLSVETLLSGGRFHARLWGTQPREGNFLVESRTISRKGGTVSEANGFQSLSHQQNRWRR